MNTDDLAAARDAYARLQQDKAREGLADNQCTSCGSYRLDGRPPYLHETWCPERRPGPPLQMDGFPWTS